MSPALLAAATDAISRDVIVPLGAAAGVIATLALALVVPLYVTQRREVQRLLRWRELEPERGDEGAPTAADPAAVTAAAATAAVRPASSYTTGTALTPAERVTADRPALSRITAERQAIQSPSFWRRLFARGPRHPLVLSLIAILVAGLAVVGVFLATDKLGGGTAGPAAGFDRSQVAIAVLNGSSTPALADGVADDLKSHGFTTVRTGLTGTSNQTLVLYAKGFKHEAAVVGRKLKIKVLQPLDRKTQAVTPDADVVVIAGEDRAKG